jgi:hypothetical protein
MIARTISRIVARASHRSSTGNAVARPDRCPALRMSPRTSPKYRVSTTHSKATSQSGALNHTMPAPQRPLPNRRATLKSP